MAYILQHLVSSHDEVIVSNKASQSSRRAGFHVLNQYNIRIFVQTYKNMTYRIESQSHNDCMITFFVEE